MIFSGDPAAAAAVDVVVVEIKKKTDDEKENIFAINQLLDRAQKLVNHCPNIQRVWYYAVLQINDVLAGRLRQMKWAPLYSKGVVYYQDFETRRPDGVIVPTPTFALSFDAIIGDAESRNHTFLEILKSGMKALAKTAEPAPSSPSISPAAAPASAK
jgi:threonine synthase